MNDRRRGLGKGLGALIPSGPQSIAHTERPVDLLFRDRAAQPAGGGQTEEQSQPSGEGFTGNIVPAAFRGAPQSGAPSEGGSVRQAGAGHANAVQDDAVQDDAVQDDAVHEGAGHDGATPSGPDVVTGQESTEESATPAETTTQGESSHTEEGGSDLVEVPGAQFAELPLTAIRANPRQPRTVFDDDALAELTHSIREIGVLQPIVVRRLTLADGETTTGADGQPVQYELVMGERRWRASRDAGVDTIPAIVRDTQDDDLLRDALLENLHRADLNPLEEAAAYEQLLTDFGCTHDELATRIGRSRPQITNTIRLLRLPPLVQRRVAAGVLSAGHARALLSLADAAAMERLAQRIVAEGLSVRATEEIVALGGDPEKPARNARAKAPHQHQERLDAAAHRLADALETRVSVAMGRRSGKLTVEFADVEDLERILAGIVTR